MLPYYEYSVNVSGLDQFTTDDGPALIRVPVPATGDMVVLPFEGKATESFNKYPPGGGGFDLDILNVNAWGYHGTRYIDVVNTDYGKMIEARFDQTSSYKVWPSRGYEYLQASNETPDEYGMYTINKTGPAFDDLVFRVRMAIGPNGNDTTNATVASLVYRPLYPIANNSSTSYTIPARIAYVENYTSWIYLDESLKPINPGNHTIEIYVKLKIGVGVHPYDGSKGNHYVFVIRESIPEGVNGYVPVTVQYIGNAIVEPEELF